MKIAIAADHLGVALKRDLVPHLEEKGHEVIDLGVDSDATRADYPDIAQRIGAAIHGSDAERGIAICGSGVGVVIAANKIHGVYASVCHDTYSAAQGVRHDNMNVLCLGGMIIGRNLALEIVDAFLGASFDTETPRYAARFDKVLEMERSLRKNPV